MANKRKPRLMISLDEDSLELLERLEKLTGLSPAQIIQKLFPSHLADLHTYLAWLEQLPEDGSATSQLGRFLLHGYGPNTLTHAIKQLDPAYKTDGERFASELATSMAVQSQKSPPTKT